MTDVPEKEGLIRVLSVSDLLTQELTSTLAAHTDEVEFIGNVESGREAIEKAQTLSPDVVLVSASVPDMDGIEVIHILRKANTKLHIISASSSNNPEWIWESLHAGANDYLSLPVSGDQLFRLIQRFHHRRVLLEKYHGRKKQS
ncbi:MAG: response regulator transcription factor [Anaerolineae bacterium]|nr:response regulator transcription factor [Anaerolineae bacterium]